MRKEKWWLCVVPLYAFTLVFVLGPALYMVAVSFAQNTAGTGFRWAFTLENFARLRSICSLATPSAIVWGGWARGGSGS